MLSELSNPIPTIQEAKHRGVLLYGNHTPQRMIERGISSADIENALDHERAQVVDHSPNPDTLASPSCIVLGWNSSDIPLHVRVAYKVPMIVTVYEPTPPKWTTPFKR